MPCLEAWDVEREQQRKKRLGAGQLAKLADGMLGQVPLTGRERLEKLNRWLCDLHDLDLR
jgi:hypothetical protein